MRGLRVLLQAGLLLFAHAISTTFCCAALIINPEKFDAENHLIGPSIESTFSVKKSVAEILSRAEASDASARELRAAALILINQKENEKAVSIANKAVVADPKSTQGHYLLGTALLGLDQYKASVEAFRDALQINPNHAETLSNLGVAYYKLNDSSKAIVALIQSLEVNINNVDAWCNYIAILSQQLVDNKILETPLPKPPKAAKKINTELHLWHWQAALKAMEKGEVFLSVRHFLQSLSLELNDPNVHNDFAVLLSQLDRELLALPFLKAASVLAPDSTIAKKNRERLSAIVSQQMLQSRIENLQLSTTKNPTRTNQLELAQALSKNKQYKKAYQAMLPVVEQQPPNPKYQYRLAWLLLQQASPTDTDREQAIEHAKKAWQLTQYKQKECYDLLVTALQAAGRGEEVKQLQSTRD